MEIFRDDDLATLLSALFDSAELRRWVRRHVGPDAHRELPAAGPPDLVAGRAAQVIAHWGRIDDALWAALETARPHHAARIRALAERTRARRGQGQGQGQGRAHRRRQRRG